MNKPWIEAHFFWDEFGEHLTQAIKSQDSISYHYFNPKPWTEFMTDALTKLGMKWGYRREHKEIQYEYMRIDIMLSRGRDNHPWFNPWDLDVAIELENNEQTWWEEIFKLHHINCGLKVLISYHPIRNGEASLIQRISEVFAAIADADYNRQTGNWLLIFGPSGPNVVHENCPWRAYTINEAGDLKSLDVKYLFSPSILGPA